MSGHFRRLRDAEDTEHGGRDVLQRAVWPERKAALVAFEFAARYGIFGGNNKRNRVGGVRCLRTTGCRVDHLLSVAVVSGKDHGSASALECGINLSKTRVHGLDRLDGRWNLS